MVIGLFSNSFEPEDAPQSCQPTDYRIDPTLWQRHRTIRQGVWANLEAIKLLKRWQAEGSQGGRQSAEIPPADLAALAAYSGWGMAPELFMNPVPAEWRQESARLQSLLSEGEWAIARNSINTAFYTPLWLVEFIYQVLERLGVGGGRTRFLELGCGSGRFLGLVPGGWSGQWTGVEMDPIAGGIAQLLYPNATIHVRPLERVSLPTEFDVVVGNVPYTEVTPFDPQFRGVELGGLHNYFIARGIQSLRAGGVLPLLTSAGTLQSSRNEAFREWLSQRARLLAAIKFPSKTFEGTEAPADLLIFQRLGEGEIGNGSEWVERVDGPLVDPETEKPFAINRYYQTHPHHVLGEWYITRLYGGHQLATQMPEAERASRLDAVLETLPQDCFEPAVETVAVGVSGDSAKGKNEIPLPTDLQDVRPYTILWYDEDPWQRRGAYLQRIPATGVKRKRLFWLTQIRDALREVITCQWESDDEEQLGRAQRKLGRLYDQFTNEYGWIHNLGNEMVFGEDPDFPLLLALEVWDADFPEQTQKADIFCRRTIRYVPQVTGVSSAQEALVQSLAQAGDVDLELMASLYGKSEGEIVQELQTLDPPLIFRDPRTQAWLTQEDYLSGNVREKLRQADIAAQDDPSYLINVEALKAVQPTDLKPGQIYAQLSSPWLPDSVRTDFIAYLLHLEPKAFDPQQRGGKIHIQHSRLTASWSIDVQGEGSNPYNHTEYGTHRVNAVRLVELILNHQLPEVYDYIDRNHQRKNVEETRKALVKQKRIRQAFQRWVWSDWRRGAELCEIYNNEFNCFRRQRFNGAHLKYALQGVSLQWQQKFEDPDRAYQLNAAWRILTRGNTLVCHPTGAGKTATIVLASQLMRRYQLCHKPCLVTLDATVLQQAAEAAQIYPGLQILPISSRNLDSAKKRREMVARIATGNWDLIVSSQTALKMMPLKPQTIQQLSDGEINEVRQEYKAKNLNSRRGLKNLEKKTDRAKEKIAASFETGQKDTVYTEDTGIDYFFVDESQRYLGLETETEMRGVLGISSSNSEMARDLYYKSQYLSALHGEGKGLVLLTATPIQNTLGQAWVNLVYLCPHLLKERHIRPFDAFISNFAEPQTNVEITAAGTLELKTRLAEWSNFPELKQLWWTVTDTVTAKELKIPLPKVTYRMVEVPASPVQLRFFEWVVQRAIAIRDRRVDRTVDNYPRITTEVRRGVVHPSLLRYDLLKQFLLDGEIECLGREFTKTDQLIEDTYAEWAEPEHQQKRLTQIIFCDLGTPTSEYWSVYRHIKQRLVEKGIPEREIAFVHDAKTDEQKQTLFKQFRLGGVRILIASRAIAGAGAHFPDRLRVCRDLDCPLRPADLLQGHGRIVRYGNQNPAVEVVSYITVGKPYKTDDGTIAGLSPDSYLYDVVRRKMQFIEQMHEESEARTVADIDEATLNFGKLVAGASGDPRLKEKIELDARVEQLLTEERDWQNQQVYLNQRLKSLEEGIIHSQERLTKAQQDAETLNAHPVPNGEDEEAGFEIQLTAKLNGTAMTRFTDANEARKQLLKLIKAAKGRPDQDHPIGVYRGFAVFLMYSSAMAEQRITLKGQLSYVAWSDSAVGLIRALNGLDWEIGYEPEQLNRRIESDTAELHQNQELQKRPFQYEDELKEALQQQNQLSEQLGVWTGEGDDTELIASA